MRAEYDFSKAKRGAIMPQKGKTRISIFIDNAVLDEFRARASKAGTGYQTMMNEALRRFLSDAEPPLTEAILRHVLRQEIPEYLHGSTPTTVVQQPKRRRRSSTRVR
jgi:BrnA antitoxin of type II toxin-antitoxin system